ncbi:DDE Tnp4 domain-containing protein [Aphis craccivora]|uniref:DDE Tnp4 domain-containing protein n=1 Tax=Aphis craccivora TaxID=307492 RepID=A0A6G0Y184_APHCR|nr:DDE Tnp4 domain-containing protein [Aphis craccivora]
MVLKIPIHILITQSPNLFKKTYWNRYTSASLQSDFSCIIRDPEIFCSTPILSENISNKADLVKRSKLESRRHVGPVPIPLRNAYFKKTPVKSGVVLPLETKNCFPKRYDINDCSFFEEIFKFSYEEWSHMIYTHGNGKKLLENTKYPIMFRKRIRTVNNTCVINAKRVRYHLNHCNVYMYCSHAGCKTFRIRVQSENGMFVANVYSSGLDYHHNPDDNALTKNEKGF